MAQPILVPQVGQDLTEAKIVELFVKLGDTVKKGDLVAVVESEKASFEVEAFAEGIVISLPFAVGDVAPVLEPLMHLGAAGEEIAIDATIAPAAAPAASPADTGPPTVALAMAPLRAGGNGGPVNAARRASPVAKVQAAARGLDVADIAGSGPGGAVVLKDVLALASSAGAGGDTLEIRTLQSGQGTPVVFLHGFGADLSAWRPLLADLGLGLPLMALDLPGHGSSRGHHAAGFAEIVAAVGQSLQRMAAGVHLVGHSLGAAVAVALTEGAGLDVRSLTLIAPAGLGPWINGDFVKGFLEARSEPALAAWMRRLVCDPASLAPVLVRATLAARADSGLVPAQERTANALFEGSTQLFSVAEALRRFPGPCTVIAGRDDAIVSLRDIETSLPGNVALHRLAQVGHLPQVEAPRLVLALIARSIRSAG